MAEIFGVATDSSSLQTAVTPQQGIVDTSEAQATQALAQGIQTAGKTAADLAELFQENQTKGVIADFTLQKIKLFEAFAQGKINRKAALTRSRTIVSEFVASNPSRAEDIININNKLLKEAGLAGALAAPDPQQRREQKEQDDAFDAGFITKEGLPDIGAHRNFNSIERDAKALKEERAILAQKTTDKRGEVGLEAAEFSLEGQKLEKRGNELVTRMVKNQQGNITNRLERLREQVAGGLDPNEAAITLAGIRSGVLQQVNAFAAEGANQAFATNAAAPLLSTIDTFGEIIKGGVVTTVLENQLKRAEIEATLNLFELSPDLLNLKQISSIFRNIPLQLLPRANALLLSVMKKTAAPPDPLDGDAKKTKIGGKHNFADPETKAESRDWISIMTGIFKVENIADKSLKIESIGQLEGMLKSIDVFKGAVEATKDYQDIVKFLADVGVGKFMVDNPIDATLSTQARRIIVTQYNDNLLPQIREKWLRSSTRSGTGFDTRKKPTQNTFEPVFEGSGVVFRLREGITDVPGGAVQDSLEELNNSVGVMLNQMIRLDAHLSRNTNYKKVWEEKFAKLFTTAEANEDGTRKE